MDRIVKINGDKIMIGTKDGGLLEVRREDLGFDPAVGDIVNVYTSENDVVVAKEIEYENKASELENNGISININNQNASNNTGLTEYPVGKKVVNKVAYILLAIFLGSFGVHKFYSGKIGIGVVFVLFCWTGIPSVIGVIEGIIAIFKRADLNGNIVI